MTSRIGALVVASLVAGASYASAMQIAAPLSGAVVRPGTTVHVRVVPTSGEQIQDVVFVNGENSVTPPAGVLEADLAIPSDAVGPEFVVAWARLADDGVSVAFVELVADPGPLTRLVASGPPVLTTIGQLATLRVMGVFADGVTRNVSGGESGTTYASGDSNVVGVYTNGVVQARGRGTGQIVVTNRGRSAVVTIPIMVPSPADNRIPVPNAGADRIVAPEAIVTLDGSGTSDPDRDAFALAWQQTKGPAVLLRGVNTAAPYFVAPRVSQETVLEFALTATDSKDATSFPSVVRITVRP